MGGVGGEVEYYLYSYRVPRVCAVRERFQKPVHLLHLLHPFPMGYEPIV